MASSDITAEITYLRVLCSATLPANVKAKLLYGVDASYFGFYINREIYRRILAVMKHHTTLPTMLELITDPALSDDAKDFINDRAPKKLHITKTLLRSLGQTLLTYKQIRVMLDVAKSTVDSLSKPDIDVQRLLENAVSKLNAAREAGGKEEVLHHFGKGYNAGELVDKLIHGLGAELVPTGFKEFDDRVGGFPKEGLVVLAATTSGGKSTICNILLRNFYLHSNMSVVKVTLEMSDIQELRRIASNMSRIEFTKFTRASLTDADKKRAESVIVNKFVQHGIDNDCVFTIWSPSSTSDLDSILMTLNPYKYNVIAIDYISLLDDSGKKEDHWKFLESVAKRCKNYTRKNKCLIILLAQLDEETEKIRYSRAIKENADVAWVWSYCKREQRESHVIQIHHVKGRDSDVFSFDLIEKFHVMDVSSEDVGDISNNNNNNYTRDSSDKPSSKPRSKAKSGKQGKTKKKDRPDTDVVYDDSIDQQGTRIDPETGEILNSMTNTNRTQQVDELDLDAESTIDYDSGMF